MYAPGSATLSAVHHCGFPLAANAQESLRGVEKDQVGLKTLSYWKTKYHFFKVLVNSNRRIRSLSHRFDLKHRMRDSLHVSPIKPSLQQQPPNAGNRERQPENSGHSPRAESRIVDAPSRHISRDRHRESQQSHLER